MDVPDPAFGRNNADGGKYGGDQDPSGSLSEEFCYAGITGIGNEDHTTNGEDDPNGFHTVETLSQKADTQDGNKNGGQVGKERNGGGILG